MNQPKTNVRRRISLCPIGVVERASEHESLLRIFPEYCAGLKRLENFSHAIILYWMHFRDNRRDRRTLLVFPRKHAIDIATGVFACRSPSRPNPIGLCVTELLKIEECKLTVRGLDALESSPIVDVKPYIPRDDSVPNARTPDWTKNGQSNPEGKKRIFRSILSRHLAGEESGCRFSDSNS